MRQDKVTKDIIEKLSNDFGLPENVIKEVVSSQFVALSDAISNRKFIQLPRLGKFIIKAGQDKYLPPERRVYEPLMKSSNVDNLNKGTEDN